jgi:anti-sigma regulatory factor (Ser/Thr protein kinase)
MPDPLSITIRADFSELERLQTQVTELGERLDIPAKTLFQINLALEEVLTNVIKYAYDDPASQTLTVKVAMDENEFQAEIIDRGRSFNPLEATPPDLDLPIEKRPIGGLGIHLVRTIMDHLDYRRVDDCNHFTMKKQILRA